MRASSGFIALVLIVLPFAFSRPLGDLQVLLESAIEGGTVIVPPGNYEGCSGDTTGSLRILKSVNLVAGGPVAFTCEQRPGPIIIVSLTSDSDVATVQGIVFVNATGTSLAVGGALIVKGIASFVDCAFLELRSTSRGGAISLGLATLRLTSCVFSGNSADNGGAAIYTQDGVIVAVDCEFRANVAKESGGGVLLASGGSASFDNCDFVDNGGQAAGVSAVGGMVISFTDCDFTGNFIVDDDPRGGAVAFFGPDVAVTATFTRCTMIGNLYGGGVLQIVAGSLLLDSVDMRDNTNSFYNKNVHCKEAGALVVNIIGTTTICADAASEVVSMDCKTTTLTTVTVLKPAYICNYADYSSWSVTPTVTRTGSPSPSKTTPRDALLANSSAHHDVIATVVLPVVLTAVFVLFAALATVFIAVCLRKRRYQKIGPEIRLDPLNTHDGPTTAAQNSDARWSQSSLRGRSPSGGDPTMPRVMVTAATPHGLQPPRDLPSAHAAAPSDTSTSAGSLVPLLAASSSSIRSQIDVAFDASGPAPGVAAPLLATATSPATAPPVAFATTAIPTISPVIPPTPVLMRSLGAGDVPREDWMIRPHELALGEFISSGAFGSVYKGQWHGATVAVKMMRMDNMSATALKEFHAEARFIARLHPHPNVVQFLGVLEKNEIVCIVSNYIPGGSLLGLINSPQPLSDLTKTQLAEGVAAGMLHLASEGVVHRDLAARNILIDRKHGHMVPLICDFGMSRATLDDGSGSTRSNTGPIKWMAPECLTEKLYSHKSDIWAFGVLLYELYMRTEPYAGMSNIQVAIAVSSKSMKCEIPPGAPVPGFVIDVVRACMIWDRADRLTQEAVHQCFIANKPLLETRAAAGLDNAPDPAAGVAGAAIP